MKVVLHFSEDPTITTFTPRPSRLGFDCVWTIEEAYAPLYWFPRDCPRAAWWRLPTTTEADAARWLGDTDASMVLAMECSWWERMRGCQLYAYRFDAAPFVDFEDHGVHICREAITPLAVEPVGDLLARHAVAGHEFRLTPSLWPLHRALTQTSLHWSFIRMRNAIPTVSSS